MLQLQMRAIECVAYRVAGGMKKHVAQEEVATVFGKDTTTLRSWEQRLKKEFGDDEVKQRLEVAANEGLRTRNSEDRASSWQTRYDQNSLKSYARRYNAHEDRARQPAH